MRAWVRAAASSMRSFGMPASIAFAMPPSSSTSWMWRPGACARARGSAARRRTSRPTGRRCASCRFPAAARAGCCGRCGPRNRSAAPAPRRAHWCAATGYGPASPPSPRCRCATTLLNTSCAVSDQPEVWQCVRSDSERGSWGSNCFISFAQSRRAARSLATSMKKFMPIAQKNDRRGAKRSTSSPAAMPARTYSTPSASV